MVYGVFSGEYSDWSCEGYFDTKKEAIAYCKEMNNRKGYEDYYVKVLYNLTEGKDRECKKAYYYSNSTKEWGRDPAFDDDILKGSETLLWRMNIGEELVIVFVKDEDAHKVPKIAQDAIAKYWAEREGL